MPASRIADVVLVDDVREVRALLRSALRFRAAFRVVGEAGTAVDAIDLVARLEPAVVVLDLGLPDLDGHQLLARIREVSPSSRVVVFAGSDVDDPETFADRGCAYVRKDRLDQLMAALETLVAPPAELRSELSLPAEAMSVALARAHVRRQTSTWRLPLIADDAAVVVSELTTNAIQHGCSGFDLHLSLQASRVLRIEVADHGLLTPQPRTPRPDSERGRGLFIVSVLATAWGVEPVEGDGKVVWAELNAR